MARAERDVARAARAYKDLLRSALRRSAPRALPARLRLLAPHRRREAAPDRVRRLARGRAPPARARDARRGARSRRRARPPGGRLPLRPAARGVSGIAEARERAARFVASFGDETARRRAAVLCGAEPPASADAALERWAEQAGVFRGAGGVDPLAALPVLGALADLRDARLGARACASRKRSRACRPQDGSFGAATSDEEERVFATGRLAAWLARLRSVRQSLLDAAATTWRRASRPIGWGASPGVRSPPTRACFANVEHEQRRRRCLQWCGRELERGFRAAALRRRAGGADPGRLRRRVDSGREARARRSSFSRCSASRPPTAAGRSSTAGIATRACSTPSTGSPLWCGSPESGRARAPVAG